MKSALFLALAGSTVAAPSFGDFLEAFFGGDKDHDSPQPTDFPNFPPVGTGSGLPFPFPTATGAPFPPLPIGTSGVQPFPDLGSDSQEKRNIKGLHIDYQLAAIAAPVVKRRELKYRQLGVSALPSFSLLDPNAPPTATKPATSLPTELPTDLPTELPTVPPTEMPGLPVGIPIPIADEPTAPYPSPTGEAPGPTGEAPGPTGEAPVPTGEAPYPTEPPFPAAGTGAPEFPGLPTTLGTVTRGPLPTAAPDVPGEEDEEEKQSGNWWLEIISDLLDGDKGAQD